MKKETIRKDFLYLYLLGGLGVLFLLYTSVQYVIFKNSYIQEFSKNAHYTSKILQNILQSYEQTLEKVATDIKEKDLFTHPKAIADTLEKAYIYGIETTEKEKVRISGINWVGLTGAKQKVIGRLGEIDDELTFPSEYLSKLENQKGIIDAFQDVQEDFPLLNLGLAIRDGEGAYRGFLNARINLTTLRDILLTTQDKGHSFLFFDKNNNEIFSNLPIKEPIGGLLGKTTGLLESIFVSSPYVFPLEVPVSKFSYILRFGYDKRQMYILFLKENYLSFILVLFSFFIFSSLSYFYHKKFIEKALCLYKKRESEKNLTIKDLIEEKQQLLERQKILDSYIKSFEISDKEEKKFYLEINKRISHSLSKMLDVANFLLNRIQDESQIDEESKNLMGFFEKAYMHSRFFTMNQETELVSINDLLEESLTVLSKQILKKELHVKRPKETVPSFLMDRVALKQVLLNILGRSIKNSPKKGEIHLKLFSQEKEVALECKDNGYLGENSSSGLETFEKKTLSLDCLSLEKDDIEKLIKSLGGTFSAFYKPNKGNTLLLTLPSHITNENNRIDTNFDNLISFPNLRKKI